MDFLAIIMVVTVASVQVQGKNLDLGRQVLSNPSQSGPQSGQQRTKEIILYLTPSQIRALQQGQGLINPPQVPQADSDQNTQAYLHPQSLAHHQDDHLRPHLAHPQPLKTPTIKAQQSDPFVPIIPPPDYRPRESVPYNTFQLQNQKRILKPIQFFPDEAQNNGPKSLPASKPQELVQGKDNDSVQDQINHQQLKEQWLDLLNRNIAHFKALDALTQHQREKSNESKLNFHYISQNDHRYNDRKYASDVYNLVRSNTEHRLKKQQALLQSEGLANSSPIFVHKEINIKHTPGPLVAQVSVPTPILISVPEYIKLNAPGAYGSVPVPIEIKKHILLPATKNVYINKPFFVDNVVPLENSASNRVSLPTHIHEWHH